VLTQPDYLKAVDGLPLAVQCSISTEDQALLSRLEPVALSWRRRLAAMSTLHDASVHVILRLWPFIPDLCGNIEYLLACAKDAGIEKVLYADGYPDELSLELIDESGILVKKVNLNGDSPKSGDVRSSVGRNSKLLSKKA